MWKTGDMPALRAWPRKFPLSAADGYYYFAVTAGQFPWAGIYALVG